MQTKQKSRYRPSGCKNIWEVHLQKEQVREIYKLAISRKRTMSWIVRFCVHKLCRKKILNIPIMQDMSQEIRSEYKEALLNGAQLHRFQLCLYGEDEVILRTLAIRLNMTVSMIIRIALRRYLSIVTRGNISEWRMFWFGIKLCKNIKIFTSRKSGLVEMDFRHRIRYAIADYHKPPPGGYPVYLQQSQRLIVHIQIDASREFTVKPIHDP